MATFAQMFPARDLWVLQQFSQCLLAVEETLQDRIIVGFHGWFHVSDWWVDGRVWLGWYASGQLRWRENYDSNEVLHGLEENWHESGHLSWRVMWKNGRRELEERWYESGQMACRVNYKDGREEYWHDTGELYHSEGIPVKCTAAPSGRRHE